MRSASSARAIRVCSPCRETHAPHKRKCAAERRSVATGFLGAIFDVDGVLVDSPHEKAWRQALRELMESEWSDIRDRTSWSPEGFTSQVYQEMMSGKPR